MYRLTSALGGAGSSSTAITKVKEAGSLPLERISGSTLALVSAQYGLLLRNDRGLFLPSSRCVWVEAGSKEVVLSFQTDQLDLCCFNCSAEIVDELLVACGYEFEAVDGVL